MSLREFDISKIRFYWRGPWESAKFYKNDELVSYGGRVYVSLVAHTSDALMAVDIAANRWMLHTEGTDWKDAWTGSTFYKKDDVVKYGGSVYICIEDHTSGSVLETDQAKWETVANGYNWLQEWTPSTTYKVNDVVTTGGNAYVATTAHTSGTYLQDNIGNWNLLYEGIKYLGNWQSGNQYKINDLVKNDSVIWRCKLLSNDVAFDDDLVWEVFIPGLGYEDIWDENIAYQKGDIVRYGGYTYLALEFNTNSAPGTNELVQDAGDWEVLTTAYNYRGEYLAANLYKTGDIALRNGYLYLALKDQSSIEDFEPDTYNLYWELLSTGYKWRNNWTTATVYYLGDVVILKGTSYVCVAQHTSSNGVNDPITDAGTYWSVHLLGDERNELNLSGDILIFDTVAKEALPIGNSKNSLTVSTNGLPEWTNLGESYKVYYVDPNGTDAATSGAEARPFRSIKYACDYILADEASRSPATIRIQTGTYEEILPISIPADVALVGDELRSTQIKPASGFETSNMFYMRNGSGLRNCTLNGLAGTLSPVNQFLTRRPSAGAYVSLDPGSGPGDTSVHITTKSPYVQNVTNIGTGCVGLKVDGTLHNAGNKSIVANDFTQVLSDGIGVWVNDTGVVELVSVFTYYCHIGYLSENGGKIRATNGNNSYGEYGSVAEGFDATETPITAAVDNQQNEALVDSVVTDNNAITGFGFSNMGQQYTSAGTNTITITGSGTSATATINEYRDNAVSNVRISNFNDSSSPGGNNYTFVFNNAQSGDKETITLELNDAGLAAEYIGQRIFINKGTGAGQYGWISGYDEGTNVATVSKDFDDSAGWEHVNPGTPIEAALDSTSQYFIEPRVTFPEPAFSASSASITTARAYEHIIYGDRFVAVSNAGLSNSFAITSTDGITWTSEVQIGTVTDFRSIAWSGTKYYLSKFESPSVDTILISTDGITWTDETLPFTGEWTSVASDSKGTIVAVTSGGFVAYSTNDGASWTNAGGAISTSGQSWHRLVYGNGRFVIFDINSTGAIAYTDNNGASWTTVNSATPTRSWRSVAYGNGMYVAISTNGYAIQSVDGINWSDEVFVSGAVTFNRVAYGNGVFLATRSSAGTQVAKSYDGINWTITDEDSTEYSLTTGGGTWNSAAYGVGKWVVINNSINTFNIVQTGRTPIARAKLTSGRVREIIMYDPGGGYTSAPVCTIFDNAATSAADATAYVNNGVLAPPVITNAGTAYVRASATVSGDGLADIFQTGLALKVSGLNTIPSPGASLVINGIDDVNYKIVSVIDVNGTNATINITPSINVIESPAHDVAISIREQYSQVRLTGHDFLDVGTGNFANTKYPDLYKVGITPANTPQQFDEVVESNLGRVFYTSTDQDGNFRVGELFRVEQATGIITISADFFDLTGLQELRIGGVSVGGSSVVINEISTDGTFVADSNQIIPTQQAVAEYVRSRISGGGADIRANQLNAGLTQTFEQEITSVTNELVIDVPNVSIKSLAPGGLPALYYFNRKGGRST
jgi:hypothetical protein